MKTQRNTVIAVVLLLSATIGAVLWMWFRQPDPRRFEPLVAALAAKQLTVGERGIVDLRQSFPGLTPHDELWVLRRDDGSFLAFVPTFYGKGTAIAGLLYTSRPMQLEDTAIIPLGTSLDKRGITVGPWKNLEIDTRLNERWYRVSKGI